MQKNNVKDKVEPICKRWSQRGTTFYDMKVETEPIAGSCNLSRTTFAKLLCVSLWEQMQFEVTKLRRNGILIKSK